MMDLQRRIHPEVVSISTTNGIDDPLDQHYVVGLTGDRWLRIRADAVRGMTEESTIDHLRAYIRAELAKSQPLAGAMSIQKFMDRYGVGSPEVPREYAYKPAAIEAIGRMYMRTVYDALADRKKLQRERYPTAYMDEHQLCIHDGKVIQKRDCKLHWEELESEPEPNSPLPNSAAPPRLNSPPPKPPKPDDPAKPVRIRKPRTARSPRKPRAPSTSASAGTTYK